MAGRYPGRRAEGLLVVLPRKGCDGLRIRIGALLDEKVTLLQAEIDAVQVPADLRAIGWFRTALLRDVLLMVRRMRKRIGRSNIAISRKGTSSPYAVAFLEIEPGKHQNVSRTFSFSVNVR